MGARNGKELGDLRLAQCHRAGMLHDVSYGFNLMNLMSVECYVPAISSPRSLVPSESTCRLTFFETLEVVAEVRFYADGVAGFIGFSRPSDSSLLAARTEVGTIEGSASSTDDSAHPCCITPAPSSGSGKESVTAPSGVAET